MGPARGVQGSLDVAGGVEGGRQSLRRPAFPERVGGDRTQHPRRDRPVADAPLTRDHGTAINSDKLRALHLLRQIKALGVSIVIDDFGTGYSSLDTLHSFPFDQIKIDKSVPCARRRAHRPALSSKAVLALGQSLNVPLLAVGIETVDQLDLLKEQGCDEAQGYYFGRPGSAPSQATMAEAVRQTA